MTLIFGCTDSIMTIRMCLWNLNFFPKYRKGSHAHIREGHTEKSARYQFHGGGKALQFSSDELGGVGHCFTWHAWVSLCFYINFRIEKLVDNGLCAMWHLGHHSKFPAARIKILLWKINRLLLYLWLLEITKVRIKFLNYLFKAGKIISCIQNLIVPIVLSGQQKY